MARVADAASGGDRLARERRRPQQVLRAGEALVQDRLADGNARFRTEAQLERPARDAQESCQLQDGRPFPDPRRNGRPHLRDERVAPDEMRGRGACLDAHAPEDDPLRRPRAAAQRGVQRRRRRKSRLLAAHRDAGERRERGLAPQKVVVDAQDGDVLRDAEPRDPAGGENPPTFFHVAGARAAISNNKQGGSTQSTTFAAVLPNGTPFSFGNSYDEGQSAIGFKGSIDEIRVRNGSVSDDWAFAEEATVSDPDFLDATGALVPGSMIWLF